MKHYQVGFQPGDKKITIHHGATLLEAAGLAGIILSNPCGGTGRCGKCKVQLMPSKKEVLACQYIIEHDTDVFVPDASRFFKQKILEHSINPNVLVDSAIKKVFISESCGLEDLPADISRDIQGPYCVDKDLKNEHLKNSDHNGVTAVLTVDSSFDTKVHRNTANWHLVNIENGDTTDKLFGLAVDIGTTTVVARLIDLRTSDIIATVSSGNPQVHYGIDVISRIGVAETDQGLASLHQTIVSCLNSLLENAAQESGIETDHIYEAVIVGNTTMNHLLLKYPLRQLGQAPYQAHSLLPTNQKAASLGLHINNCGNVHTPPNIAGFVGSDTVAAALACGLDTAEAVTLLVDIGTNGEIVLGTKERLFAASCAAGPALEGAGITCGSRAQDGAIERVVYDQNDIDVDVIGQTKASTICGSGLIDAVAILLDTEIIDSTGRFTNPDEFSALQLPDKIKKRVVSYHDEPAFILINRDNLENAILLTQKDVRQIQLAKAAIQAGILLLLKKAGYDQSQIQQVLLAGAFGNYIQKENAVRIGLLPNIAVEKVHFVGNAAGSGAQMILINRLSRRLAERLAQNIEYLEIAHQAEFQNIFSECMLFPQK